MLVEDKTFTIYHQNIQSLAIETYKAVNNLPGGKLSDFLVRNNHNDKIRCRSEITVPSINTVFKGQNSIILDQYVIWNSVPAELRETNCFLSFQFINKSIETNKVPL